MAKKTNGVLRNTVIVTLTVSPKHTRRAVKASIGPPLALATW
jgi:hypothetical protein